VIGKEGLTIIHLIRQIFVTTSPSRAAAQSASIPDTK
jgi:hypothetical protein